MTESDLIHDQAAAYVLGALDPEEAERFASHLAGCTACQAAVDDFSAVTSAMDSALPSRSPRPDLKARLLERIEAERGAASSPAEIVPLESGRRSRAAWYLAAASIVAAIGLGWSTLQLTNQRDALEVEIRHALDAVAGRDSLLNTLLGSEIRTATLTADGVDPSIRLYWNDQAGRVLVVASNLPPAASGRTYQLWGLPSEGVPVSLGTFNTDVSGNAVLSLTAGAVNAEGLQASAVTDEPTGGSAQPTTTPFLVGPWSASQ